MYKRQPPEVVTAHFHGKPIAVHPSADIWALGVMAFEVLSGRKAVASMTKIDLFASEKLPYPWEEAPDTEREPWRKLRLWALVKACLSRAPDVRPTAAAVVQRLELTWQSTTS